MLYQKNVFFIDQKDLTVTVDTINNLVKVTHIPTNTVTECNKYKSPYKNKIEATLALKKLLQKV